MRFASKLIVLEGLGPLAEKCLAGIYAIGKAIVVVVDNSGTVGVIGKFYGRGCPT